MHVLEYVWLGNTLEDWSISLLIIIGVLLLNKLLALFNRYVIHRAVQRTRNEYDDMVVLRMQAPVLFGITLAAIWVAFSRLSFGDNVGEIVQKAYKILIVLNGTWFVTRVLSALLEVRFSKKKEGKSSRGVDLRLVPVVRRVLMVVLWTMGVVMALNNVGVKVTTLLGALGIGGLAAALAAQDTLKNILGGFTIFFDQPFRIGDWIIIGNIEGHVEDIGLRSTRIRTLGKRLVTMPNSQLIDASIENVSAERSRRVVLKLGLTYDTPPDRMRRAIEILNQMPKVVADVEEKDLRVFFSDYGDSALTITFIYFMKRGAGYDAIISNVNMTILEQFNAERLSFAFPTQTIYIEKGDTVVKS